MTDLKLYFLVGLILVSLILISGIKRDLGKVKTNCDFFLHGEKLHLSGLVGTLVSTNLSLGNMIFVCGILGYFYGWSGVFWVVVTIIMLGIGFQAFGRHFKPYVETKGNFGSVHDFIATSHANADAVWQNKIRNLSVWVSGISLFIAIILEAHLGTLFLANAFQLPQTVFLAYFLLLVVAYTAVAGFFTVVFTDLVQFGLMFVATVAGVILFVSMGPGTSFAEIGYETSVSSIVGGVGAPTAIGLVVLGFFWLLATPDTWQRNCASRNIDLTKKGTTIGVAALTVWVAVFAIGGMEVRSVVEPLIASNPDYSKGYFPFSDVFLLDFASLGSFPSLIAAAFGVGLIMAAISTIDTFLVIIASGLNNDVMLGRENIRNFDAIPEEGNSPLIRRGRTIIVLVGFAVFAGWFVLDAIGALGDPLSLFFVTYTIQFSLAMPVVFACFGGTKNAKGAYYSIGVSALVTIAFGLWALVNYSSDIKIIGLGVVDLLALIPVVPVVVGGISFALFRSN